MHALRPQLLRADGGGLPDPVQAADDPHAALPAPLRAAQVAPPRRHPRAATPAPPPLRPRPLRAMRARGGGRLQLSRAAAECRWRVAAIPRWPMLLHPRRGTSKRSASAAADPRAHPRPRPRRFCCGFAIVWDYINVPCFRADQARSLPSPPLPTPPYPSLPRCGSRWTRTSRWARFLLPTQTLALSLALALAQP